jgi:hypothetical protein
MLAAADRARSDAAPARGDVASHALKTRASWRGSYAVIGTAR